MDEKRMTGQRNWPSIVGTRSGKLVVTAKCDYLSPNGLSMWVCVCDCGNQIVVRRDMLQKKARKSCGCIKPGSSITHGKYRTRLYHIWNGMRQRCSNPNSKDYKRYGGKGITVCAEWKDKNSFVVFEKWALENGYAADLSIDRIRGAEGYSPSNCRWANNPQQSRNICTNKVIVAFGESKLQVEWLEDPRCKVGRVTLQGRLRLGWDAESAITTPSKRTVNT